MANPNPVSKFQKGNKVAGRKPGQLCLAFEQRRGDKRSAIFGAWFSAGIAVGEWATARAGTWDICGLPGSRIDSSNLCPGSSKVGLVLLIRNLLSTQWPAYYFSPIFNSANY